MERIASRNEAPVEVHIYFSVEHEAVQAYFTRRQTSSSAFKAELSNRNLLNDEACWDRFIADKEKILKDFLDFLNFYHGWWLLGISKEKSEPL